MEIKELDKLLDDFKAHAIQKFKRGRAEHNDDLSTIDYDSEIYDEITDILIYLLLRRKYEKTPQQSGQAITAILDTETPKV